MKAMIKDLSNLKNKLEESIIDFKEKLKEENKNNCIKNDIQNMNDLIKKLNDNTVKQNILLDEDNLIVISNDMCFESDKTTLKGIMLIPYKVVYENK